MIVTPECSKAMRHIVVQQPNFMTWLRQWHDTELRKLPEVHQEELFRISQGRCQALAQLIRAMEETVS